MSMFQSLNTTICEQQTWLEQRGPTRMRSGYFGADRFWGSFHTDYGPQGHEKASTNQDFVLGWQPSVENNSCPVRLVVVLADGLTSSFQSGRAAELACWVALRNLVENSASKHSMDLAIGAFNAAGRAIGGFADHLTLDSEPWHPTAQFRFRSTWKYILDNGKLLETTLTLAWLDRDHLRIAILGDGGAVRREADPNSPDRRVDHILAECDLTNQQVNALGPANRSVTDFDCWREQPLHLPFMCVLYTDGIGRGLKNCPESMLNELEDLRAAGAGNPAREYIRNVIQESPDAFADNLTLAVIHASNFTPLGGSHRADNDQHSHPPVADPPVADESPVAGIGL